LLENRGEVGGVSDVQRSKFTRPDCKHSLQDLLCECVQVLYFSILEVDRSWPSISASMEIMLKTQLNQS